ncbi:MAG: hypothetical protein AAGF31_03365 [Planctomycetota bacterium]
MAALLVPASSLRSESGESLPRSKPATVDWRGDHERMVRALELSEAFRQQMLSSNVDAVGELLEAFRLQAATPGDRPGLRRFNVTQDAFRQQLGGKQCVTAEDAFVPFAGLWYGIWDQKLVDHDWSPVFTATELAKPAGELSLGEGIEAQYAWIGDGFGWNLLVDPNQQAASDPSAPGRVVLGYVYMVALDGSPTIRREFPLVGFADGPGRIIWVTPSTFFFEEVLDAEGGRDQRYAITGSGYQMQGSIAVPVGEPFQAVYTRDEGDRPAWVRFPQIELAAASAK